jgi:hypothetical protein
MDLTHAKSTKELLDFKPKAKSVSHFFERKPNEDSFYFCSIFRCTEKVGILVTRYGDQDLFRYFLARTKTAAAFQTVLDVAQASSNWTDFFAAEQELRSQNIVFETLPIKMTVVFSLDFTSTVEVNAEPIFMDRKILDGYERVRRNGLVQKGVGSYKV